MGDWGAALLRLEHIVGDAPTQVTYHPLLGDLLVRDLPTDEFVHQIISGCRAALHYEVHEHLYKTPFHHFGIAWSIDDGLDSASLPVQLALCLPLPLF